jgi:hypothetical protein
VFLIPVPRGAALYFRTTSACNFIIGLTFCFCWICSKKAIKDIELRINKLTPVLLDESDHYLNYILNRRTSNKPGKLTQEWAGGLKGKITLPSNYKRKH